VAACPAKCCGCCRLALHPLADLLDSHDLQRLLAHLLASARVLCELSRVRRHARLCAQPGAHFLNHDLP
jgi:hypothetical protein